MDRHQPGDVVHTTKRGVEIRYSPSMGSSTKYRVVCPHGEGVNARTLVDAREDARQVDEWCIECAANTSEALYARSLRAPEPSPYSPAWWKAVRSGKRLHDPLDILR